MDAGVACEHIVCLISAKIACERNFWISFQKGFNLHRRLEAALLHENVFGLIADTRSLLFKHNSSSLKQVIQIKAVCCPTLKHVETTAGMSISAFATRFARFADLPSDL